MELLFTDEILQETNLKFIATIIFQKIITWSRKLEMGFIDFYLRHTHSSRIYIWITRKVEIENMLSKKMLVQKPKSSQWIPLSNHYNYNYNNPYRYFGVLFLFSKNNKLRTRFTVGSSFLSYFFR